MNPSSQTSAVQHKKIAIVHDWLYGGGAEQVVLELHQMFPDAPIYTSYCTPEWRKKLDNKVITGYLNHWPFTKLRKFLPLLRIWWFEHLDLSGFDLVISSSGNGEAKGIKTPKNTTHICYCHTPTHFYWRHYNQYLKHPGFGLLNPVVRFALKLLVGPLRRWDYKAAQRPDFFIANSTHIQNDIQTFYGRDAVVIHPPVDVERFAKAKTTQRTGFVTMGRQVPYKHTDLIIKACNELRLPLKVIGRGPEHDKLVKLGGPTITFLTDITDQEMPDQLASAEAFIFAAYEDFGIAPIEAMATGTPVIAYKAGGALDYVLEGQTGIFFDSQNTESLVSALRGYSSRKFTTGNIRTMATKYSSKEFRDSFESYISSRI